MSIPLSLGLLGALSIIRFRTPIKEPEEVGFIMLVIAAAISSATFNFRYLVILYVVAFISLLITRGVRTWKCLRRDGVLVLTIPDADADSSIEKIHALLKKHLRSITLESSSSRDGVSSFQFIFSGLRADASVIQSELRKLVPIKTINFFLDRPGGIR